MPFECCIKKKKIKNVVQWNLNTLTIILLIVYKKNMVEVNNEPNHV